MNRHAYLIIIHNNFYNFEKLIQMLDDERNDIYVHVNKKVKNFDFDKYKAMVKKSKLTFSKKRVAIFWGSPLLLEAEMILLDLAYKSDNYSYFHLISGADLPIKSMDYIYDFFESKNGNEFVDFDTISRVEWLDYYYPLLQAEKYCKKNRLIYYIYERASVAIVNAQKKVKIHRTKAYSVKPEKGSNWFSITSDFAAFCIERYYRKYRRLFKYTILPEENFVQMMINEGGYRDRLYSGGNMRLIKWDGGNSPLTLDIDDYDEIMQSGCLFARKFDGDNKVEVIDKLFKMIKEIK
ncbi:MAG: hypothetical protein IJH37_08705 [Clostridia bacterium]|nr:hypothetical protein [Clostridia bacterium]